MTFSKELNTQKTISCVTIIITDTQDGNSSCSIRIDTNLGQEMYQLENWTTPESITTTVANKLAELGYTETV
jgi:hypothetical protein